MRLKFKLANQDSAGGKKFLCLAFNYPGCQRSSRSPAARSVRASVAPNEKKTSGTQGSIQCKLTRKALNKNNIQTAVKSTNNKTTHLEVGQLFSLEMASNIVTKKNL